MRDGPLKKPAHILQQLIRRQANFSEHLLRSNFKLSQQDADNK